MFQTDVLITTIYKFQEEQGRRLSLIGNCSMLQIQLLVKFLSRLVILEPNEYKFYQKYLDIFILGIQGEIPYYVIKNCDFAESVKMHYLYGWPHDIIFFDKHFPISTSLMARIFSLNAGRDFLIINGIPKDFTKKERLAITVLQEAGDNCSQIIRVSNYTEGSDLEAKENGTILR